MYADKVLIPSGNIIEKYHQIHYPQEAVAVVHVFAARVSTESKIMDKDEVSSKRWFTEEEYLELLRTNGTKDGVSILAVLYALQFYK